MFPAASADKLRDAWQSTQAQPNGTVEVRRRFMEKGAACVPNRSDTAVSVGLEARAGAAAGDLPMSELIGHAATSGKTYGITIAERTLTLAVSNTKLNNSFTKIG